MCTAAKLILLLESQPLYFLTFTADQFYFIYVYLFIYLILHLSNRVCK